MSLLVDLMRHAEDPAYAEAARRSAEAAERSAEAAQPSAEAAQPSGAREPAPAPARRPRRAARVVLGAAALALVGVATGVAVASVRGAGSDDADVRSRLAREVQSRTAESDALTREAAALRSDVAARRQAALEAGASGRAEADRLAALELSAGTVAVSGPGVVVTLSDRTAEEQAAAGAEPAVPRGGSAAEGRVLDRDLQALVNALWAAGAEAVSIDDLRLTTRTAIRSAGEAVLVDFRPLSSPYVVRAVGDPGRLEPAFVDSPAGRRLATYTSLYGLGFEVHGEDGLRLPAGTVAELRSATAGPS